MEIFRAYHSRGQDLANIDVMLDALKCIDKIDRNQANEFLKSADLEREVVDAANHVSTNLQLTKWGGGVPHIKCQINDEQPFEISGAQEYSYFIRVFENLISNARI